MTSILGNRALTKGNGTMANVLIIDDNPSVSQTLSQQVESMGHRATCVGLLADGLQLSAAQPFDVILLDVHLPDGDGLTALPALRATASSPEIIIITGDGDPNGAEVAVKAGAWDYIVKPIPMKEIRLQLTQALAYREEKLSKKPLVFLRNHGIVGSASNLTACLEMVAQSAGTTANVLITGETGTGKELFARAIHDHSARAKGNFVVVDCAALPETLVESVLFGHEKGAFTGAHEARPGLIKEADGGTLFLDEVGELPLTMQKTFLRVLQERSFRPVGGNKELPSDFRLIAATNRNLETMSREKRFRQDLLYRLRTIEINLPSLRERTDDLEPLVLHFTAKTCKRYGLPMKGFSPAFIEVIGAYAWPGNVRELESAIEGAVCRAQHHPMLYPKHLPTHVRVSLARTAVKEEAGVKAQACPARLPVSLPRVHRLYPSLKGLIHETEKAYLKNILCATNGDIQKAVEISRLSRTRLYVRLKKHNLINP